MIDFEATNKTYILPFVDIIYKGHTIPKDSVGTVGDCYYGDTTQITMYWNTPNGKTITICFNDDFFELVKNNIFVDISTLQKPKTKPLFQEGDLVKWKIGINRYGIITNSKYDYSDNQWMYIIGEYYTYKRFEKSDLYFDEDELEKVNEVKFDIENNDKEFEMIIREKR